MRNVIRFHPTLRETLEDRTVPSALDGGWLTGLIGPGDSQVTQQVRQAFQTFEQNYAHDVWTVLYGRSGPSATTRTAFNAQVAADLQTLEGSIQTALGARNAALDATINDMLTGSSSTSLRSELAAIPTPTVGQGRQYWLGPWQFLNRSYRDIVPTAHQVEQQVRAATKPTGTIDAATVRSLLNTINAAYRTFRTSYWADVRTNLPATGTPTAAQATAFRQAVDADVATLTTTITDAVQSTSALAPIASSLAARITNDLQTPTTGATDASLQERLDALPLPGNRWFSRVWFRVGSDYVTSASQIRVSWDVINAVRAYNRDLA